MNETMLNRVLHEHWATGWLLRVSWGCETCRGLLVYKDKLLHPASCAAHETAGMKAPWMASSVWQWLQHSVESEWSEVPHRYGQAAVGVCGSVCTLRNYSGIWGYMPKKESESHSKEPYSPRPLKKYHSLIKRPGLTVTLDGTNGSLVHWLNSVVECNWLEEMILHLTAGEKSNSSW